MASTPCPDARLRILRDSPVDEVRDFVLYWMIAERRPTWNFGLQQAAHHARQLNRPLVILEPLDCTYRWACDRFHAFIIEGMKDNAEALSARDVTYYPYVEPEPEAGRGLLAALADRACVVVADDRPAYRYPLLLQRAAARLGVRFEVVDSVGVLPVRSGPKEYKRAVDFRRHVHKTFAMEAPERPLPDPLAPGLPADSPDLSEIQERWPPADLDALLAEGGLADLPIDHDIGRVEALPGGASAAADRLEAFLANKLENYPERNHPDAEAASGLSPWLHFGHAGGAQVAWALLDRVGWEPEQMNADRFSKQGGAWGLSEGAEAFLEEIITWRELCQLTAVLHPDDHARYDGLPEWARKTLAEHASDPREAIYELETMAEAHTQDALWNAAQRQLRDSGVMHNYLRMLWGKRVLAWTETPQDCWDTLVELNNRYALDGRDANSYGGIAWVLGRYDRAWGPERPIYGKIRYMTSQSTRRKLRLNDWLDRWSP